MSWVIALLALLTIYVLLRTVWQHRVTTTAWKAYRDEDGDVDRVVARLLELHRTSRWPRWLR